MPTPTRTMAPADIRKPGTALDLPIAITRAGSHTPTRYKVTKAGYGDTVIEIVPNRERIEHVVKLEKGVSGRPAVVRLEAGADSGSAMSVKPAETGSATRPDDAGPAVKQPDPPAGSGSAVKPPEPPMHDPACDEIPPPAHCLKDQTRGAKDGAGGSAP